MYNSLVSVKLQYSSILKQFAILDEETDILSPLPEFTRRHLFCAFWILLTSLVGYMNMVLTKGKIPLYGAKSTEYWQVQLNLPETIYNGRAPLNAKETN